HAFDDRESRAGRGTLRAGLGALRAGRGTRESLADAAFTAHPSVEVVGRPPRHRAMKLGIDEVGADLECLHGDAAATTSFQDSESDRRLADTARDASDDDRRRSRRHPPTARLTTDLARRPARRPRPT